MISPERIWTMIANTLHVIAEDWPVGAISAFEKLTEP